jgi:hypothetical protein
MWTLLLNFQVFRPSYIFFINIYKKKKLKKSNISNAYKLIKNEWNLLKIKLYKENDNINNW